MLVYQRVTNLEGFVKIGPCFSDCIKSVWVKIVGLENCKRLIFAAGLFCVQHVLSTFPLSLQNISMSCWLVNPPFCLLDLPLFCCLHPHWCPFCGLDPHLFCHSPNLQSEVHSTHRATCIGGCLSCAGSRYLGIYESTT